MGSLRIEFWGEPIFPIFENSILKNILEIAMDFPDSKFRSRDRARARPRALRGIPRVAVWGLSLGPASSPGAPRCSETLSCGPTHHWDQGPSLRGCNMVQTPEDFEESKFSSDRDRARAGPRALRVIARMEGSFLGTPWMACLAPPDWSGSVFVVPRPSGSSSILMEVQGGD